MRLQPELFKKGCIFNSQTIKVHYFWQHSILFGPGFLPSFTWIFLALSLPRAFLFIYFFGFRMSEVHLSNYKLFFHFYSSAKPSLLFVHQYSITIIFIISILFTFFNKNSNHSPFFFFFWILRQGGPEHNTYAYDQRNDWNTFWRCKAFRGDSAHLYRGSWIKTCREFPSAIKEIRDCKFYSLLKDTE